jgi:hypothetical protein
MRDPLPPAEEHRDFALLRKTLNLEPTQHYASAETLNVLRPPDKRRLENRAREFFSQHHPFIRHIVRRTREFLESTVDPYTHEPYLKPVRVRLFGERRDEAVPLTGHLRDAYEAAEAFCAEVSKRPGMRGGFLKTLLLRRTGSTIEAGRKTAVRFLDPEERLVDEEVENDEEEQPVSALYPLTEPEKEKLRRFLELLRHSGDNDPKLREVERYLFEGADGTSPWLEQGCIVFTQYYDSAWWVAERLSARVPEETIALYAQSTASGVFRAGTFTRLSRETIKEAVRHLEIRLLIGTDAASEGLNLQKLGTLINLDLPWNPTRLEQRKGRIQRIGQVRDEVWIANLRYRGSVEDRVHELLSDRLAAIHDLFGQLPDTLEDVWVAIAQRDEARARQIIDAVPNQHPFEMRYDRIEPVDWESCSHVLDDQSQIEVLMRGW